MDRILTGSISQKVRCHTPIGPHPARPDGEQGWIARTFSLGTLFVVALLFFAAPAPASDTPAVLREVGFDQRLGEQAPLDLQFADETGKMVRLGDYFGHRPVVLVLAYFRCPMLCTLVLNGMADAMRDMPLVPGKDYEVVTVSFDPRETPKLAAAKKKNYVAQVGRPGQKKAGTFLPDRPRPSAA